MAHVLSPLRKVEELGVPVAERSSRSMFEIELPVPFASILILVWFCERGQSTRPVVPIVSAWSIPLFTLTENFPCVSAPSLTNPKSPKRCGVPSVLHEANAVMGRANRMLAGRASAVATSFPLVGEAAGEHAAKSVRTGNPVREAVIAASGTPYSAPRAGEPFDLLVFGGSQGARYFSQVMAGALECLAPETRARLALVQQCRAEDIDTVRSACDRLGVTAELAPFFSDMPARIAGAHLVLCRSGASSVSELAVIGRPSVLVPLPHALDNDQGRNAEVLARAGGAWPVNQAELSPERLAALLTELMDAPERLAQAAEAARAAGRPDAVSLLADLVEHVAARTPLDALAARETQNGDAS